MAKQTVKKKFPFAATLAALAGATFLASFLGGFPSVWVENAFARPVFPTISHISGLVADAVPFSLLDGAILVAVAVLLHSFRAKRWRIAVGLLSFGYLWFFWTWGINYHRPSLEVRLGLKPTSITQAQEDQFARLTLEELNRLHPLIAVLPEADISKAAAARVRHVVSKIDGHDWLAASRVKHSVLGDLWFRVAGIEGMFNPFGHEPLLTSGLLNMELPFNVSHELAHVRGIANEGDASLIAFLATIASADPAFQYSGWLHTWSYVGNPELYGMLAPGPKADLKAIGLRRRSQQIRWASNLQSTVLDLHLKANDVKEGVRSYSRFVAQAIASRDRWEDYR